MNKHPSLFPPTGLSHRLRRDGPGGAYAALYGGVLWPVWERLRRRRTVSLYDFVERSQWLAPSEVDAFQLAELRKLLVHAKERIPYYREVFAKTRFEPEGVTSRADLEVLPVLTREIVRERYRDLVDPAYARINFKKGTSGSTGTPLKFEYSPESEWWRQAIKVRGYEWSGYRPGAKTFFYWAFVAAPPGGAKGLKMKLDRAMRREIFIDSMKQDEASRATALAALRKTRPEIIICYTQSCANFARWVVEKGLRDWPDIPVLCGAEGVLAQDRAALTRAFGPHIFETYGSRETMLLAAECDAHDGMHLSEENLLVEVCREGKAAPLGESGDILVTDLHNYGMPMIRYQNGDVGALSPTRLCPCGRGLRKLMRVDGRRADMLMDKDGSAVPGIIFHVLFSDARKEVVKQFQAIQKPSGDVTLRIVRGQDWSPDLFREIHRRFSEYLRGYPVVVEEVDAIPPAANGKMKTIVRLSS